VINVILLSSKVNFVKITVQHEAVYRTEIVNLEDFGKKNMDFANFTQVYTYPHDFGTPK